MLGTAPWLPLDRGQLTAVGNPFGFPSQEQKDAAGEEVNHDGFQRKIQRLRLYGKQIPECAQATARLLDLQKPQGEAVDKEVRAQPGYGQQLPLNVFVETEQSHSQQFKAPRARHNHPVGNHEDGIRMIEYSSRAGRAEQLGRGRHPKEKRGRFKKEVFFHNLPTKWILPIFETDALSIRGGPPP